MVAVVAGDVVVAVVLLTLNPELVVVATEVMVYVDVTVAVIVAVYD